MKKLLLVLTIVLALTGCSFILKEKSLVENTSWVASDNSEMVFEEKDFKWYKSQDDHSDNYYYGTYEFYIGEEAVEFITTDLSSYNVTEEELEGIFARNANYSRENFVVFNLNYDGITIDGETTKPSNSLVPWYGFILDDNTVLDVANMNTGTYYSFTKK